MPKQKIPVYNIADFNHFEAGKDFYANTLTKHFKEHHFIQEPHKHDFYITVLFTMGNGVHEIDFFTYPVKPGSVFFLSPGQTHNWKLSKDCEGYIFFHSTAFYDLNFTSRKIKDYPFFTSIYTKPLLQLKTKDRPPITALFIALLIEYEANNLLKKARLTNLSDLIYIGLARLYEPTHHNQDANPGYLSKLAVFEQLIEVNYKDIKFPKEYAKLMNISEKHINRICKQCLNKTSGDVISDRVIIEARRLLISSKLSVNQIAEELGYTDPAYFSRLFKKKCAQTPLEFVRGHKSL